MSDADKAVTDWYREIAASDATRPPFTRDLILRPTDRAPGIYDDDDGPTMVATMHGTTYALLWFDRGTAEEHKRPGDVLMTGVYPTALRTEYPADGGAGDGVVVEEMDLTWKPAKP